MRMTVPSPISIFAIHNYRMAKPGSTDELL